MRIAYNNLFDDGTLTASSEATGYAVENTQNQRLAKVWRSTDASTQTVVVNLATAQTITVVAVMGHNLTSAANITLEGNTSDSWPGATSQTVTYNAGVILKFFTGSSYQYWRFTIEDTTNTDGYLEIGRLWIGTYMDVSPSSLLDFTVTKKRSDMVVYGKNRQKFSTPGIGWREFRLSFPVTANAMIEQIEDMYDDIGNHGNLIFCNFDTERSYSLVDPCYCSINGDMSFRHQRNMRFTYDLSLEEDK